MSRLGQCPECREVIEAANVHICKGDMVNSPAHYASGNIECIEAITEATKGLEGIEAVCTGNAIKYLWRWKRKGGLEDLRKARWYINRILGENA